MADKPTHKDSNPSSQKSSVSSTENPAHSQLESIRFLVASPEPLKMTETSTQPATKDNSQPAVESSRDHTRSRAPSVPSTTLLDELDEPAETVAVGIGANTGTAKAGTPVHDISRNTQDSDSEAGSMIEDMPFPQTTPPFDDESSITSGFKIGFAEDKNKKYRRTMEVDAVMHDADQVASLRSCEQLTSITCIGCSRLLLQFWEHNWLW